MKKLFILTVSFCCLITFLFTFYYAIRIYQSTEAERTEPEQAAQRKTRIVMITKELESPFTRELQVGFNRFAKESNMEVTVWGTYHANLIELLKYMDIAIASKVDGIVVQAMDGPEFVEKVKKATEKGIPVITVGVDAPTSLRKTYVGPDHSAEGELIGGQIARELKGHGMVYLLSGSKMTSTEKLRLEGVERVLTAYPDIQLLIEEGNESELNQSKQLANRMLNRHPDLNMFVGLNAEAGTGVAEALKERGLGESENIYTFDDTPELREMVDTRRITATLTNDNTTIGETCLSLIRQWLQHADLPLPRDVHTKVSVYHGKDSL